MTGFRFITAAELATIRERHDAIAQDALVECGDCLPTSMCLACADDERFHTDRDTRLEER